jgi:hypothetical protein
VFSKEDLEQISNHLSIVESPIPAYRDDAPLLSDAVRFYSEFYLFIYLIYYSFIYCYVHFSSFFSDVDSLCSRDKLVNQSKRKKFERHRKRRTNTPRHHSLLLSSRPPRPRTMTIARRMKRPPTLLYDFFWLSAVFLAEFIHFVCGRLFFYLESLFSISVCIGSRFIRLFGFFSLSHSLECEDHRSSKEISTGYIRYGQYEFSCDRCVSWFSLVVAVEFRDPVNFAGYLMVIKNPMDLGTIRKNLKYVSAH